MKNSTIVELEARRIRFFSRNDEEAFFEWLDKLTCVEKYFGQGDVLYISLKRVAVDEEALRELLAISHRYGIDIKQLRTFDCDAFSSWFRDSRAYWFGSVFGEDKE
ncbi:hypothetical protein W03_05710 [Nitrosomonas sp. PY1]|uniref:hypothetical protein n=1 Tax=Nitrosomonas sp. PY1 TaxID=1803906 RepID=UPI001FC8B594|nr:hypothetical protein [Nitrosomonas sp. PY1]GKS68567.1 hypothetical protein W03_05710 [Nitrosomonas sp. PY1]